MKLRSLFSLSLIVLTTWAVIPNAFGLAASPEFEILPTGHPDAIFYRVWNSNGEVETVEVFDLEGIEVEGEVVIASNDMRVFVPIEPMALGMHEVTLTHSWIEPVTNFVEIVPRPEELEFSYTATPIRSNINTESICCGNTCRTMPISVPAFRVEVTTNSPMNLTLRSLVEGEIHETRVATVAGTQTFVIGALEAEVDGLCVALVATSLDDELIQSEESCADIGEFPEAEIEQEPIPEEMIECHDEEIEERDETIDEMDDQNEATDLGEPKAQATCSVASVGTRYDVTFLLLLAGFVIGRRRAASRR